jgi:hypothetical protein
MLLFMLEDFFDEERIGVKWTIKDLEVYLQEKEYVDTAIIPLVPFTLSTNVKMTVSMGEFIHIIANEIERQFKGRVFLFPPFTYLAAEGMDEKINRITAWSNELKANGMKHIFYMTADAEWKAIETRIPGTLIWLPAIPLEHVDEKYKHQLIGDQISQLMNVFIAKWS